jgi:hypothetical protein
MENAMKFFAYLRSVAIPLAILLIIVVVAAAIIANGPEIQSTQPQEATSPQSETVQTPTSPETTAPAGKAEDDSLLFDAAANKMLINGLYGNDGANRIGLSPYPSSDSMNVLDPFTLSLSW